MLGNRVSDTTKLRVRALLARFGVEVAAYTGSFAQHRDTVLREGGVATVWDVGAHVGQYASALRRHGYRNDIVSIEPAQAAFEQLEKRSDPDPRWHCHRLAVGAHSGQATLNVAANGQSSSLLAVRPVHIRAAPGARDVGSELVPVATLDSLLTRGVRPLAPYALKLDVQGSELTALQGASALLADSVACEVELSLVSLYENDADWMDVVVLLQATGFRLSDVERVFFDPESSDLLQLNGLFVRTS